MNVLCSAKSCPVILSSSCVFYEGENLIYSGINTNDSVQLALQKLDEAIGSDVFNINVLSPLQSTGGITPILSIAKSSSSIDGYLSSIDWNTFNNKQNAVGLTTTGSTGASTFDSLTGALNIPDYSGAFSGFVPIGRTVSINGTTYDLSANRTWSVGTVTSVGITMPSAFTVSNSPITGAGTINITAAGLASQYVRGDGVLGNFPSNGGGGSSVSYYLNGSVNQGTFGGSTYYEINRTPVVGGAGVNFSITNTVGLVSQFITDPLDPGLLLIPAGNWNIEFYFNASDAIGSPYFYVDLYVYNGTTFTLISSGATNPEYITNGTSVDTYYTSIAVPETTLTVNDRLAIRVYGNTNGNRTLTLHTEDDNLSQVITTFSNGLTALNGLTRQVQYFATGTTGTDFTISSSVDIHTFNLPTASASNRGALSSSDWTTFNSKQNALSGTGFVKVSGTTISYDNSTYYLASNPSAFITLTSLSSSATGLTYNNTTGVFSLTSGYVIPTTTQESNWNTAYTNRITSLTTTGTSGAATLIGNTLNIPQYQAVLTNPVTGTGVSTRVAFWNGTNSISSNSNLYWDDVNSRLGIGNTSPTAPLDFGSGTGTAGSISKIALYASPYGNYGFGVSPNQLDYVSANSHVFYNNSPSLIELFRIDSVGNITSSSLVGTGTRMVVASSTGVLSTQAISVGTVTSIATSGPITGGTITSSGTIGITKSTASTDGYLSSVDWLTFNSKVGGSGVAGQVAYWDGTNSQAGSVKFLWDNIAEALTLNAEGTGLRGLRVNQFSNDIAASSIVFRKSRGTIASPANVLQFDIVSAFEFSARVGGVNTENRSLFGANMATATGIGMYFIAGSTNANLTPTLYIHPTGNVVINGGGSITTGGTLDSGQRLQVYGDAFIKGSGATSATTALTIQASDSSNLLSVRNDQFVSIGTLSGTPTLSFGGSSNTTIFRDSGNFALTFKNSFSSSLVYAFRTNSDLPNSNTSGTNIFMYMGIGYAPTSGTGTWIQFLLQPTINQTGGANGITRGLYVAPTLTAAADWRSIEWSNNTGWGLYGAGTANNYFGGSLAIGVTSIASAGLRVLIDYTSTKFQGVLSDSTISGSLSTTISFASATRISASAIISNLIHFNSTQASIGAGSSITSQYGFFANSSITAGTFNFGFYGDIPNAANRWNLYMAGTADNYLAGKLLINTTTVGTFNLDVNGTARVSGQITSEITGNAFNRIMVSNTTNATSSFVVFSATSDASAGEFQFGKYSTSKASFAGINAKDGFIYNSTGGDIVISNAASTGIIKLFAGGSTTAQATLTASGNLLLGTTTDTAQRLQVTSTASDSHLLVWGATAPSIRIDNAGSAATQRFVFGLATATNNFIIGAVAGDICMTTQSSSPLLFGANALEVMRITTSRNLLIGTNTDSGERLQVSGSVLATSFVKSGGTSSQYLMADGSVTTGGGGGSIDELQVALLSQVYG